MTEPVFSLESWSGCRQQPLSGTEYPDGAGFLHLPVPWLRPRPHLPLLSVERPRIYALWLCAEPILGHPLAADLSVVPLEDMAVLTSMGPHLAWAPARALPGLCQGCCGREIRERMLWASMMMRERLSLGRLEGTSTETQVHGCELPQEQKCLGAQLCTWCLGLDGHP